MLRHKNPAKFHPDAENKSFVTATSKQTNADSQQWNEVLFDNPHNNQIHVVLHLNQVNFNP